ncbi:MAG: hypothetical protein ABIU10_07690, partial [Sphingomicrobium sp.]
MKNRSKITFLALGALTIAAPAAADPREAEPNDPTCTRGGSPAVLVRVSGLKNGAGKVRVQAYGPGASKHLKKGGWAGRVDVPLAGRRSVDICLPLPAAGHYSV